MENLSLEQFEPTTAALKEMAEQSKNLTVTDYRDKKQLETVKRARIDLRDARVLVTKKGKELREGAIKFQKAVIEKEKELIAIIEPEEERLQGIEEWVKAEFEAAERREALPKRKNIIADQGLQATDEELLAVDDAGFIELIHAKIEARNLTQARLIEEEERRKEEEKERLEAEKRKVAEEQKRAEELRLAQEKAREDERRRIKEEARASEEKRIKDEHERAEQEAKEKAKLERQKKYRQFRADFGYTEETKEEFKEEKLGDEIVLWKKLGTFKIG